MTRYKLSEICKIVSGSTPKTNVPEYWDGENVWITPAEITDKTFIVYDSQRKLSKLGVEKTHLSSFPKGTVILSSRAPIGKVAIAGVEMFCNQGFKNLICSEKIMNEYLYWFLKGKTKYLNSLGRGATFKELSAKIIGNIELEVPSIQEQKEVVIRLRKIDQIIGVFEREVELLDELIKARFVEMFGDPIENQKDWEVVKIRDIVTDVRYGTSKPAVEGGRYPYLRMNNLTVDGGLDLSDLKYIDIPDNEIEKCVVRKGDILFNRTNSIDLIGKTAVFNLLDDMVIAGYIIRIRLNDQILPDVFSQYMNLETMKKILRGMAKGAVNQANINAQELQSIKVYIPNMELQKQYVEFKEEIDKSRLLSNHLLFLIKSISSNH